MTFEEYIANNFAGKTLAEWFSDGPIVFYDDIGPQSLDIYYNTYGTIDFYFVYMDYLSEENGLPQVFYDDYMTWCQGFVDSFYDGFRSYGGYDNSRPPIYWWVIRVNNCNDESIEEVLAYSDAYCRKLFDIYVETKGVVLETPVPVVTPSPAPVDTPSPGPVPTASPVPSETFFPFISEQPPVSGAVVDPDVKDTLVQIGAELSTLRFYVVMLFFCILFFWVERKTKNVVRGFTKGG